GYDGQIDAIYEKEFSRLNETTYLDHAGSALYTRSQLESYFHLLSTTPFANPHSGLSLHSTTTQYEITKVKELILAQFDTNSSEYSVIFTLNASHAAQLLAHIFPFTRESEYCYMNDSHNSVIGIRERVKEVGGRFTVVDHPEWIYNTATDDNSIKLQCVCRPKLLNTNDEKLKEYNSQRTSVYCLFALAAENNFNGLRPPLSMLQPFFDSVEKSSIHSSLSFPIPVHTPPSSIYKWFTLVDLAKYLSTSQFSLKKIPVDFLLVSFYKIFGYPTGVGALIVSKRAMKILRKQSYFGGGSVEFVSSTEDFVVYKKDADKFEDGTVAFTSVLALQYGYTLLASITYSKIHEHTQSLIDYLYRVMLLMKYKDNEQPLCKFYDTRHLENREGYTYGPILTFNLFYNSGHYIGYRLIEKLASANNIQLRSGCFCAPGVCQRHLGK
ncbi:unnamed protein product, partial [Didymodactylos carnosus]